MTNPCGSVCGSCPLSSLCHTDDADAPDVMTTAERGFFVGPDAPSDTYPFEQIVAAQQAVGGG